jgi:hypothetical protein
VPSLTEREAERARRRRPDNVKFAHVLRERRGDELASQADSVLDADEM